jgi:hypothetical protein
MLSINKSNIWKVSSCLSLDYGVYGTDYRRNGSSDNVLSWKQIKPDAKFVNMHTPRKMYKYNIKQIKQNNRFEQ